jgi:hypothetical protein
MTPNELNALALDLIKMCDERGAKDQGTVMALAGALSACLAICAAKNAVPLNYISEFCDDIKRRAVDSIPHFSEEYHES